MPDRRDWPLRAMVRAVAVFSTIGFAGFTLTLAAARLLGASFSLVFGVAAVGCIAIATVAGRRAWLARRRWTRADATAAIGLAALTLTCGVLACAINAPDEDDSLYVPPAVAALAHPGAPLRTDYSWIVPFANGATPGTTLGVLFNNVETAWACVSRATGVELLTLYQGVGAFIFGAAFVLAYFRLVSLHARSPGAALAGTLAVCLAAFLLFRAPNGFGSVLSKIWMGKAIVMAVMLPVVAAYALEFIGTPTRKHWLLLASAVVAATGFSSSALFLMPALLVSVTPGAFLATRSWRTTMAVPLAAAFPVTIAAFYSLTYKQNITSLQEVVLTTNQEIFRSGFVPYFGTWHSLTTMTTLAAAGYLLLRRDPRYTPLLCWFATAILLFTNPVTAGVVARHITSTLVYNRIFTILPVFLLTGTAVADLVGRSTRPIAILLTASMVETAAAYALYVAPASWQIDVPKLQLAGWPHVGRPVTRLDSGLIRDVRDIERLVPEGNTLSAADYEIAISMLTTRLPQYGLWPIDMIAMYGQAQGAGAEGQLRYGAARFLIGQASFQHDFEAMLETPIRNLVLSNRLGHDLSASKAIAEAHHFMLVRETPSYVLYTRGRAQ